MSVLYIDVLTPYTYGKYTHIQYIIRKTSEA